MVVAAMLREPVRDEIPRRLRHALPAEYRPSEGGSAIYHWHERTWEHSIDGVAEETVHLLLGDDSPDAGATGASARVVTPWLEFVLP